jgi:hypothetical protein
VSDTPPFALLEDVARRFDAAELELSLGGSGLLYAHGLATHVGDWDVTTDEPLPRVRAALKGLAPVYHGNSGVHADEKLVVHDGAVEVIVGFAFRLRRAVVRVPTFVHGSWRGVPLGSLEAWAVAYTLMDRPERAETCFAALARRGADPGAIERLRGEPLPPELSARLAGLLV